MIPSIILHISALPWFTPKCACVTCLEEPRLERYFGADICMSRPLLGDFSIPCRQYTQLKQLHSDIYVPVSTWPTAQIREKSEFLANLSSQTSPWRNILGLGFLWSFHSERKFCTNSLTSVKKAECLFQVGHNVKYQEEMALLLCEHTASVFTYAHTLLWKVPAHLFFVLQPRWLKSCLCKSHMKGPDCEFWSRTSV